MQKESKPIIFYVIIVILVIFLIFFFTRRSSLVPYNVETTTTLLTGSINDEEYIQNQIKNFLQSNPTANETYARDVVYWDIAKKEKNSNICDMIKTESVKQSCYKVAG